MPETAPAHSEIAGMRRFNGYYWVHHNYFSNQYSESCGGTEMGRGSTWPAVSAAEHLTEMRGTAWDGPPRSARMSDDLGSLQGPPGELITLARNGDRAAGARTGGIGVAVIGCGYWGANYLRVFDELPDARVAAICEARGERLQEVGRRYPGSSLTTRLDDVLRIPEVEAAVVSTTATTHHEVARRCLLAGKHVLVEKPMGVSVEECEDLVRLADQLGLTIMVGHTFIFNPAVQRLKEYVDGGQLGRLYYLYARRTNLGPIRNDVNALWDLAPHDISIFDELLRTGPDWVSAVGGRALGSGREDFGFVTLGYPDGVIGNIHVSWADPNKVRELVVVGSDRRIAFDDVNLVEQVRVFEKGVAPIRTHEADYGEFPYAIRDGDIVSPKIALSEPLKNMCRHFLECIGTGVKPITDGQAGLHVVRVMKAIEQSMRRDGAPVEVASAARALEQ